MTLTGDADENQSILSKISTRLSNYVVQYNYTSMSCALLIMASTVCTYDDDYLEIHNCHFKGRQIEWVEPSSISIGETNHNPNTNTNTNTNTKLIIVYFGSTVGQLTLGFCGDYFGRTIALAIALFLTTVGAFCSAVAPPYDNDKAVATYATIILCRFIMGVGVGAIFPLTATKAAEDAGEVVEANRITTLAPEANRITSVGLDITEKKLNLLAASWSYFWQMPGVLSPWLITLFLTVSSNNLNEATASRNWRAVLGFGCIPAGICTIVLIIEYITVDAVNLKSNPLLQSNSKKSKNTWTEVKQYMSHRKAQYKLIGASLPWFVFDFYMAGLILVSGYILLSINGPPIHSNVSSSENLILISYEEIILLLSTIPGTLFSIIYLIPKTGYKNGQFYSFLIHSVTLALMGSFFYLIKDKSNKGLFAYYTLMSCLLQIGVQITTFSIPSASFPTNVRVTLNGVSCACGKIGALLGSSVLYPIFLKSDWTVVLLLCSFMASIGAVVTYFFVDIDDEIVKNKNNTNIVIEESQLKIMVI